MITLNSDDKRRIEPRNRNYQVLEAVCPHDSAHHLCSSVDWKIFITAMASLYNMAMVILH